MAVTEAPKLPPVRLDLQIVPQYCGSLIGYVVKDPVSTNYFRLGEVEYVVLKCFQEGKEVDETRQEVKRWTGSEISVREIHRFVEQLKGANLLKSKGMSDVPTLVRQNGLRRKRKLKQLLSNYLFVTIPLWDPDRLLNKLLPRVRFFFTPYFLVLWATLAAVALWVIVDHFSVLVADAFSLLSGWNLLILSASVFSIKFLHEMGHALTCKHFGGEVHAIGPAFLVFQPCMFTDTSDAWLLPSKWDRVKISSAGIIVELMLAFLAAVIWVSSRPGLLKQVAYTVMIASSVSTLLFNANPLLRYDGYYILSDLLEIPNLRIKAGEYISHLFRRYLLGIVEEPPPAQSREKQILVAYGAARFVYRIMLVFVIGLFLYALFRPLGIFTWLSSAYGMIVMPAWRQGGRLVRQVRAGTLRPRRLLILLLIMSALTAAWFIPIDYTIQAPCVVSPKRLEIVRTAVPGDVEELLVREGQPVKAGDKLVRMSNPELGYHAANLREEIKATDARIREALAGNVAAYQMELRNKQKLEGELRELEKQIARLNIRAPMSGVAVVLHPGEGGEHGVQTRFASFTDADAYQHFDHVQGARLQAGVGILAIADTSKLFFKVFVYERDVTSLAPGQPMTCALRAHPSLALQSEVQAIIPVDVKSLENVGITLADVGYIPVKPASSGGKQPLVTLYMVRGGAPEKHPDVKIGQTGKARITYGSGPMGPFYFRLILRALRLRLQKVE